MMQRLRLVPAPIWVLLVGLALRLINLTAAPLWYDEAFTALVAQLDLPHLVAATAADVHPPLYYLLVSVFSLPGLPLALSLRLFSVACSMGALLMVWAISGEMGLPYRVRLLALAIMAVLPVEIYYAQEARQYALLQMLVLIGWLLMLRRDWKRLALVAALILYTHNYGAIYAAVIYLVGMLRELKAERPVYRAGIDPSIELAPLWSAAAAGLVYLPWFVWSTVGQMRTVAAGYWIQPLTPGGLVYALFQIVFTTALPLWLIWLAAPALGLLLAAAVWSGWRHKRLGLLALVILPLVAVVIVSLVWRPVLLFRGLIGLVPALVLLLAEAATERRAWLWSSIAVAVVAITLVWSVQLSSAGKIKESQHTVLPVGSGVMVHLNDSSLLPYLVQRPELHHYLLDAGCPADPGALTEATRAALGIQTIRQAELPKVYDLAALVGPMSTQCEQQAFSRLTAERAPLASQALPAELGINGVWHYDTIH